MFNVSSTPNLIHDSDDSEHSQHEKEQQDKTKHQHHHHQVVGKIYNKKYKAVRNIGEGGYGKVYLVIDQTDKSEKAMKILKKADDAYYKNEHSLLEKLHHENIEKYYEHFETDSSKYLYIITEFCKNGDLQVRIDLAKKQNSSFPIKQIFLWAIQATSGLKYLHLNHIIHRNIKPSNLFLTGDDVVKLGDFVFAKLLEDDYAETYTGSPAYMSPEQFRCLFEPGHYSFNSDVWSLGCTIYELLNMRLAFPQGQRGDPPLPDLDDLHLITPIIKKTLVKDPLIRINSSDLYDLLTQFTKNIEEFVKEEN